MTFFIVLLSIGGFLSTLTHGPVNHKNYCGGGRNHSTGYWTFTTYLLLLKVCEFVSLWVANMVYRKSCIRYNHKKRFAGLKKKWCSGACYCYYLYLLFIRSKGNFVHFTTYYCFTILL